MKDYILASRRAIMGTDKEGRCAICDSLVYYSHKSHMLTMGEKAIPIFCTQCVIRDEKAES